jgi:hypothetical protein
LRESLETAVEDDWEEMATSSFETWRSACEEKTLRVMITVLKSVAWIRLLTIENAILCVTVNGESEIAL